FSQGVAQQNVDLDLEAFTQAIKDALTNKSEIKLTKSEIKIILTQYQKKLTKEKTATANANKTRGEQFLVENKKQKGVVELPSGLQYKIIKEGNGNKPNKDSSVNVHYHGTFTNGNVFDSSYDRGEPISLSLNQVIKGWQEALPLMAVGSKWKIYVPSELAYGEPGRGSIGPNETLVFDIELLAIN
ncbi:MAG: FKBP-type peptidyl-prolyl cis-trans isomerase, partial [Gammaproteobacteria bacterium]